MDKAKRKCRKFHTGEMTRSPAYKRVKLELLYWYLHKAHSSGLNSNVRQLIVLLIKISIVYDSTSTNKDIIDERIKLAHKQRKN